MTKLGKRNVDFLTHYKDPSEASTGELHTARWAVQLFGATGTARPGHPRFDQPLEELLEVAGRLLVWRRTLLEAVGQSNDGAPLPTDTPLDRIRMSDLPLSALAEGDSDVLNRNFRYVMKRPRWRTRLARDSLAWIGRAQPAADPFHANADWLADGLGMAPFDRELLKVTLLRYEWRKVGDFLTQLNLGGMREAARLIATALEVEERVVRASLGRDAPLLRYGILDPAEPMTDLGDLLRLSPHFVDALTQRHEDAGALFRYLLKEAPPAELERADYAHLEGELEAARRLLANARGERGVNILLYGRPGTGKTQFARLLGREVGATVYETPSEDREGDSVGTAGRLRLLRFAERVVGARGDVLLVFDEAEDAFPAGRQFLHFSGMGSALRVYSKAWMNNVLESNPVPVVWLTNRIDDMDPAYLRRFTLHIEFREPGRSVRRELAARYLAPAGISPATIARVAEEEHLAPAQLETAARYLRLCRASAPAEAERLFDRQFRSARKAMGLGGVLRRPAQPLRYDPRFVNLEGELGVERLVPGAREERDRVALPLGPAGDRQDRACAPPRADARPRARRQDRQRPPQRVRRRDRVAQRDVRGRRGGGRPVRALPRRGRHVPARPEQGALPLGGLVHERVPAADGELPRHLRVRDQPLPGARRRGPAPVPVPARVQAARDRAAHCALRAHVRDRAGAVTGAALERLEGLVPADFANVARQLALLELEATEARGDRDARDRARGHGLARRPTASASGSLGLKHMD